MKKRIFYYAWFKWSLWKALFSCADAVGIIFIEFMLPYLDEEAMLALLLLMLFVLAIISLFVRDVANWFMLELVMLMVIWLFRLVKSLFMKIRAALLEVKLPPAVFVLEVSREALSPSMFAFREAPTSKRLVSLVSSSSLACWWCCWCSWMVCCCCCMAELVVCALCSFSLSDSSPPGNTRLLHTGQKRLLRSSHLSMQSMW